MNENIGIYKITNITNNKIYIGSSSNLSKRYYYHLNILRNNKHYNIHLQRAYNIDGESSFKFDIVEYCDFNILSEREEYYFNFFDTLNDNYGYNINPNGDRPPSWTGKKHTEETKIKMGNSSRGRIQTEYAKEIASITHKGKIISDDHKKILSEKNKGEKNPMYGKAPYDIWLEKFGKDIADKKYENWKEKISNSGIGRITSEETKEKIRKKALGRIVSDESKQKISNAQKGRTANNETKKKMSEKRKGDLNPSCKIKNIEIPKILYMINNGDSVIEISKIYNVSKTTIINIKNGKRKI